MGSNAQLDLVVIEARNLPFKSKAGVTTYVRFRVGEGYFNWTNSNRAPKSSTPKWEFSSTLRIKEKSDRLLQLKVMEAKFLSKDEIIGESIIDLDTLPHNEQQDMWVPIGNNDCSALHILLTYYPLGRIMPQQPLSPLLPSQRAFLSTVSPDLAVSPPGPTPSFGIPDSAISSNNTSITKEQMRAEELFSQAMVVLKNGLVGCSGDQLRGASDILAESLKIYRLGKTYAMLAYIFYLFDCPELQSKYLGIAEKLDPTFPVVAQLRKTLVEEVCNRKPLEVATDRLSIVLVSATGLDSLRNVFVGQDMFCRIRVGFFEEEKESSTLHMTSDKDVPISWREFFEIPLTKASERYKYANQYLKILLYKRAGDSIELLAETRPIDLFTFVRDSMVDKWLHLVPREGDEFARPITTLTAHSQPMVRVVFNYQMGVVADDEAAELLYSALYCRDRPMIESLTRKKVNLNACFKEFPYSSSRDLEPQYSTPLTKAARFGQRRIIRELMSLGADINAQDKDGFTPLMRALQYDKLYNNTRAIKLLISHGADIEKENNKGISCYSYCKSNDVWLYLRGIKPIDLYKFVVVVCSNCKFVQIPSCTENKEACLRSDSCKCPPPSQCSNCLQTLRVNDVKRWLASKNEIGNVQKAFLPHLPDNLHCCLVQCKCCTSFGFAATESARGLQLCVVLGDDIISTKHSSDEKEIYPISTSGPLWMIAHHWKGCSLPVSSDIYPVILSRSQTTEITNMLSRTPVWVHDPSPPVFALEQLPHELFQQVLGHLSCEDLAAVEGVSRDLRDLCRDEIFWKTKFVSDFMSTGKKSSSPPSPHIAAPLMTSSLLVAPDIIWKDLYVDYHLLYCWVKDLLLDETFNFKYETRICTDNGHIFVDLKLVGMRYVFNLDSEPFSFDNEFTITLEFASIGCLVSGCIVAKNQPTEKVVALSTQLALPKASAVTLETLAEHDGRVSLRLPLQDAALSRWVNPYFAIMVPGYQSFMQLKDKDGGSVILDLFYYSIESITLDEIR